MPEFEPERLQKWAGGTWTTRPPGRISGFSFDSRRIEAGACFIALKTDRRDGHQFIEAAREKGASMALVSEANPDAELSQLVVEDPLTALQDIARGYRSSLDLPVIGITGSCGKTSTKDLLKILLGPEATHGTEGNLNNTIGLPVTLLGIDPEQHKRAVVEAGINEPGEMDILQRILDPDVAVVTMVGPAHLEQLGSMEAIAAEKAKLLRGERTTGRRYFPATCLEWEPFRALAAESVIVRSSDTPRKKILQASRLYEYAVDTVPGGGHSLALRTQDGPVLLFPVPHFSPGQAQNAALAIAAALDLGVPPERIRERFKFWKPTHFRGEKLKDGDRYFYVDCYNANPSSVTDALAAFREGFSPDFRRLYVLGSMNELGSGARQFHREVGSQLFLRPGDIAFLIGEHAESMLEGLMENDPAPGSYRVFPHTGDAKAGVDHFSGAILLKGSRSYKLEQLLPEDAEPADDQEVMLC